MSVSSGHHGALPCYASAILKRIPNAAGQGRRARIACVAGTLLAVLAFFPRASAATKNRALARAQAEQTAGDLQSATRDLKAALSDPGLSSAAIQAVTQSLAGLGQCDAAAGALAKIHTQTSAGALALLGSCHLRTGDFTQATSEFQQALKRSPGEKRVAIGLARALAGEGRDEEAIQTLNDWLKIHPGDEDTLYWTGRLYQDFANQTFEQMAAAHPDSYLVYETEGAQDRARQQYPQALAAYQKALSLAPPDTPGLHFYIGDVYWRTLRYTDAERELKAELRINPAHSKASYELGDIYARQGDPQQAVPYLEKALTLDPGLIEAHRSLGRAYMEEKRYPEALHEFLLVAKADPSDHTIHAQLANAYRLMGQLKDAEREAQLSQRLENQTIQTIQENKAAEQNHL